MQVSLRELERKDNTSNSVSFPLELWDVYIYTVYIYTHTIYSEYMNSLLVFMTFYCTTANKILLSNG